MDCLGKDLGGGSSSTSSHFIRTLDLPKEVGQRVMRRIHVE
jgi:hypothetical protein